MKAVTALIIIDMQAAIDDPVWARAGPRNNPGAEDAALLLMAAWRAALLPIFHVRHDSTERHSTYRPGQPGHVFKSGFEPRGGEQLIRKHTGSAFVATALEAKLRALRCEHIVIAGVITNNSVETSVRHGATLGFRIELAEDACFTFAKRDFNGVIRSAQEVHAMTLANLEGEYCEIVSSQTLIRNIMV